MRYSDELPVDVEPYDSRLKADPREERVEATNFALLVLNQVCLRVGWIFKTESIVMPVFMDFIGGGPVLRGMLMVLNRIGFSVPPVVFSRQLKIARRKKWLFAGCSLGMAVPFALLALLWQSGAWRNAEGRPLWWMPVVFLVLYGVFFCANGHESARSPRPARQGCTQDAARAPVYCEHRSGNAAGHRRGVVVDAGMVRESRFGLRRDLRLLGNCLCHWRNHCAGH